MAKSRCVAYSCWLCGGPFLALHHLYLGRDIQWFLWFTTFGGFLVGWLSDLCKMPDYIRQANLSQKFMEQYSKRAGEHVSEWQIARWAGAVAFAALYEAVLLHAVNVYTPTMLHGVVRALGRAMGVWMSFSSGTKRSSVRWTIVAALVCELLLGSLAAPLARVYGERWWPHRRNYAETDIHNLVSVLGSLVAAVAAWKTQRYRRALRARHFCVRLPFITLAALVWSALLFSALYHHMEVPDADNPTKTRKLKDMWQEFVRSDSYLQLKAVVDRWSKLVKEKGVLEGLQDIAQEMGLFDENTPRWTDYQVLGVKYDATDAEIKARYRQLARLYHPDKSTGEDSAAKMAQVNEAYRRLIARTPDTSEWQGKEEL